MPLMKWTSKAFETSSATTSSILSEWLAGLYDPESREVVIPGRGRIPVNEESVHRVMGVPRGGEDVPYSLPTEVDIELGAELFGDLGYALKTTKLLELITGSVNFDTKFKRMWLMLVGNTVIAPTTSNKISPRWYGVLQNIDKVKDLNWSKFIVDELHKSLSKGKPTKGCLLFYNLLYIDAIDLTGLGIVLPDGPFAINVWTKKLISQVLSKDIQTDKNSYGRLPLKPSLAWISAFLVVYKVLGNSCVFMLPQAAARRKLPKLLSLWVIFRLAWWAYLVSLCKASPPWMMMAVPRSLVS